MADGAMGGRRTLVMKFGGTSVGDAEARSIPELSYREVADTGVSIPLITQAAISLVVQAGDAREAVRALHGLIGSSGGEP